MAQNCLPITKVGPLKNIQVVNSADNCVYDIFAAAGEEFSLVFPDDQNFAFRNVCVV